MKKKHVLFIVENNSVPGDRRVWNEALAVAELGFEVSVICPRDKLTKNREKIIRGIEIYRHPVLFEGSGKIAMVAEYANAIIWETLIALFLFVKHRFVVIHSANPPDHVFLIALLFKVFGVKYIFDHHDITPENYVAKYNSKGLLLNALYLMERLTFKVADMVISTNESYKKIAIERGRKKVEDVVVVRNGPDLTTDLKVQENPELRGTFKYLVGYVGVIAQQEGIENLIAVMEYILFEKKIDNIKCIVIGTGPHWNFLVKMVKEKKLERYIEFTGFVSNAKLSEILSSVDVCVNPEFKNEFTDRSTMIKVMEYMTYGKPIVQFHTTEGEYTAGDAAIYIKENSVEQFGDALLGLLNDENRRTVMGVSGRSRIEKQLSWQMQKVNIKKVYDKIFDR